MHCFLFTTHNIQICISLTPLPLSHLSHRMPLSSYAPVYSYHKYIFQTPFGKPIEEIYDGVHYGKILGSGVSGIVRLVVHRSTGIEYAVKVLDIGLIDSTEGLRQLRNEIFIMVRNY
jgi:hypothetical protein